MRYVDTSVLLAYLTRETFSEPAERFLRSAGAPLAFSSWTETELMSALGVKIRTGQLSHVAAEAVCNAWSERVAPCMLRLTVLDDHHRAAAHLLRGWPGTLRAGDALHLAIAHAHGATLHALDHGLATAATALGLEADLIA